MAPIQRTRTVPRAHTGPRITYGPDLRSIPCKAFNHAYDADASQVFAEDSLYFGRVWVQYDECTRGCGTVRLKVTTVGRTKDLTTRYRHTDPDYDTTMSKVEAQRTHTNLARAATMAELEAAS